jgi:hypothetical protein
VGTVPWDGVVAEADSHERDGRIVQSVTVRDGALGGHVAIVDAAVNDQVVEDERSNDPCTEEEADREEGLGTALLARRLQRASEHVQQLVDKMLQFCEAAAASVASCKCSCAMRRAAGHLYDDEGDAHAADPNQPEDDREALPSRCHRTCARTPTPRREAVRPWPAATTFEHASHRRCRILACS